LSPHITLSLFKIFENAPRAFRRALRRRQFTTIIRVCPQARAFSRHPAETARLSVFTSAPFPAMLCADTDDPAAPRDRFKQEAQP